MSILKAIASAVLAGMLFGCANGTLVVQNETKISEPKVISLDAPLAPWVPQIEARLKQKGFVVKRFSRNDKGTLDGSQARYVLRVQGTYYSGWEQRCFGGGYKFDSLVAELVDLKENETIASVTGEGYSEGCAPLSGSIFGDIAQMVAGRWN